MSAKKETRSKSLQKIREEVNTTGIDFYLKAFKAKSSSELMLIMVFQLLRDLILHIDPSRRDALFRQSAIFDLAVSSNRTEEIKK